MLAALCFVAGAPIAPPGANVSAAEPPPPAAANVSALVTASAAGDAVNSAALLQEVLAEVRQLRGRVEELAQAPAPDARAPLKPRTPAARRPPLPTLPTLSSSSRRQSSLAAAAGQSLLAFRPAVLMPAAASGPGSTLLAGLESLVHGVVGNATSLTSSLLARPGYSPATVLAAKTADKCTSTDGTAATDKECTCGVDCSKVTDCKKDSNPCLSSDGKSCVATNKDTKKCAAEEKQCTIFGGADGTSVTATCTKNQKCDTSKPKFLMCETDTCDADTSNLPCACSTATGDTAQTCTDNQKCKSGTCETNECTIKDGLTLSKAYPCKCGTGDKAATCTSNQVCTGTGSGQCANAQHSAPLTGLLLGILLVAPLFSVTLEGVCRQPLEPAPFA